MLFIVLIIIFEIIIANSFILIRMNATLTEINKIIKTDLLDSEFTVYKALSCSPIAGYGRCASCGCKGYISKHNGSQECKTCNHHYSQHY
jgi:regulatory protein YycI of two-component signal transduction system YycFG